MRRTEKTPCVYILAKRQYGPIYVGVTSDLSKRIWEHKHDANRNSFTSRRQIHTLVYYEVHDSMGSAISREKAIKKWRRNWKVQLIEKENPEWDDLYREIVG